MSHSPAGTFSGAWGWFTQELQTSGPQTTLFSQVLLPPGNEPSELDTGFMEATTETAPLAVADVDTARCTTPPFGMERENHYLLVVTTSIEQLSLGSGSNNPKKSPNDSPRGNTF